VAGRVPHAFGVDQDPIEVEDDCGHYDWAHE
jgi:hypothetical protein